MTELHDLVEAMLCTVDEYGPDADTLTIHFEALRAALATRPEPDTEVERLRHALTNLADNLHGAGLISNVAKADILRTAAGPTPPEPVVYSDDWDCAVRPITAAGSATPQEDDGDG